MEQREVDNMLLSMIQKHFPSLPLSDEHTDWGKWLGFARAVYEAGRASPASVPEDAIDAVTIALRKAFQLGQTYWQQADSDYISQNKKSDETNAKFLKLSEEISAILAAAPTQQVSEDRKDAERWRFFCSIAGSSEPNEHFDWLPTDPTKAQLDAAVDAAMQGDKP